YSFSSSSIIKAFNSAISLIPQLLSKISCLTVSRYKLFLALVIILPPILKTLSTAAEVAGIAKYRLANIASIRNQWLLVFHYISGSILGPLLHSLKYSVYSSSMLSSYIYSSSSKLDLLSKIL
ncbi:hypothetical protein GQ53DRAFT_852924, partial [Thozetella sp. PMI_491]